MFLLTVFCIVTAFSVSSLRHWELSFVLSCSPPNQKEKKDRANFSTQMSTTNLWSFSHLFIVDGEGSLLVSQSCSEVAKERLYPGYQVMSQCRLQRPRPMVPKEIAIYPYYTYTVYLRKLISQYNKQQIRAYQVNTVQPKFSRIKYFAKFCSKTNFRE